MIVYLAYQIMGDRNRVQSDGFLLRVSAEIPKDPIVLGFHLPEVRQYTELVLIENFFAKLKPYRALTTRYDKLSVNCLGGIPASLDRGGYHKRISMICPG